MKKYFIVIILFCTCILGLVSCNNTDVVSNGFEGEYLLYTNVIRENGPDEPLVVESPMSIYRQGKKSFVQTSFFGYPNINYESPIPLDEVRHNMPQKVDSLETIEATDLRGQVVLINGLVACLTHGMRVKPLPIEVKNASFNALTFRNSEAFVVTFTNMDGSILTEAKMHFKYGKMTKNDKNITWTVTLVSDVDLGFDHITDHITYENIAVPQ